MNGNLRGVRDLLKYLSKMHKDAMIVLTTRFCAHIYTSPSIINLVFTWGTVFNEVPFMFRCCMSGQMVDETVSNPGIHRGA